MTHSKSFGRGSGSAGTLSISVSTSIGPSSKIISSNVKVSSSTEFRDGSGRPKLEMLSSSLVGSRHVQLKSYQFMLT